MPNCAPNASAAISVASAGWQSRQFNEKSERALLERVHGGCTVVLARHEESPLAGLGDQFLWIERRRSADKVLTIYHCDLHLAQ